MNVKRAREFVEDFAKNLNPTEIIKLNSIPLPETVVSGIPAENQKGMQNFWHNIQQQYFADLDNGQYVAVNVLRFIYGENANKHKPGLSALETATKVLKTDSAGHFIY